MNATNLAGASAGTTIGSISAPRPPEGPVGPIVTALDGTAQQGVVLLAAAGNATALVSIVVE